MEKYVIYLIFLIFIIIALKMISSIIFDYTHTNPLNYNQIEELAKYRRIFQINKHYSFLTKSKRTSRKFRRNMDPDGKYYKMEIPLEELPSVAASLLQNKKYEWRILAFEKDNIVECFYINKGEAHSVSIKEDLVNILKLCDECEYSTIFDIHNHPSGVLKPSSADITSCDTLSEIFDHLKMNFFGFIVANNVWKCYYRHTNTDFLPIENFIEEIEKSNNLSKEKNLALHTELRKLKSRYKNY